MRPVGGLIAVAPREGWTLDRASSAIQSRKSWRWVAVATIALAAGFAAVRGAGHRTRGDADSSEVDGGVDFDAGDLAPTGVKSQARADSEKGGQSPTSREPSRAGRELAQARDELAAARSRHRRALLARLGERIRDYEESDCPVPEGLKAAFGALKTLGKP